MSIPGEPVCRSFHAVAIGTELIRRHQGNVYSETSEGAPQLIMTYTALLFLAILRDDFFRLDRPGLISFLKACQNENGR